MNRSRSRSPLKCNSNNDDSEMSQDDSEMSHDDGDASHDDDDASQVGDGNDGPRGIKIENIPNIWSNDRARKFVEEITKSDIILRGIKRVQMFRFEEGNMGSCFVRFINPYVCNLAMNEWSALSHSRQFVVKYDVDNIQSKMRRGQKFHDVGNAKYKSVLQSMRKQNINYKNYIPGPNETYGLSLKLLKDLEIQLPLRTKLHVTNLPSDITEAKLREVFGFAGKIVNVFLKSIHNQPVSFAKIEYDHPVEAVQAIAMFNQQMLYSKTMSVHMDRRLKKNLPEGLSHIGPGLGPGGEPLKGVRNIVEIQPLKQDVMYKINKLQQWGINLDTNISTSQQDEAMSMNNQMPVAPSSNNSFATPPPPIATRNYMNPQPAPVPNMQLLQNMTQPDTSVLQQAVSAIISQIAPNLTNLAQTPVQTSPWQTSGPTNTQNSRMDNRSNSNWDKQSNDNNKNKIMADIRYDDRGNKQTTSRDEVRWSTEKSDMLLFKNLPSSVSLKVLSSKVEEVGDVKFAELTGNGRAIVRFFNNTDAERCIKLFDKSKVDGKIIDVSYF